MNKCLNCGKEIAQKEGKRQRKFCDNKNRCKQEYHNKNKPKEPKYVQFKSFQDLKDELDKAKAELKTRTFLTPNSTLSNIENGKTVKNNTNSIIEVLDETTQKRISELEYELAHPPANFSSVLAKKTYFFDRNKELKSLK